MVLCLRGASAPRSSGARRGLGVGRPSAPSICHRAPRLLDGGRGVAAGVRDDRALPEPRRGGSSPGARPARPDGLRSQLAHLRPRALPPRRRRGRPMALRARRPHLPRTHQRRAPTPRRAEPTSSRRSRRSVPVDLAADAVVRAARHHDASRGSPNPPTPERVSRRRVIGPPSGKIALRASLASSRAPRRRIQSRGRRRVRNLNRPVLVRSGGRSTPRRVGGASDSDPHGVRRVLDAIARLPRRFESREAPPPR